VPARRVFGCAAIVVLVLMVLSFPDLAFVPFLDRDLVPFLDRDLVPFLDRDLVPFLELLVVY
jgi:hypothetical protein